jgi:hypothetical protein
MRRSITAGSLVVVALAAAGCGSGGGTESAPTTTPPAVTAVATTPAPTTTTSAPSTTTAPTTTTTAPITDATTADSKALAAQLQTVLDRYDELSVESLLDPDRPFVDQQFIDDFRLVAQTDVLAGLLQRWQQLRSEGVAAKLGPSGGHRQLLTTVTPVSVDSVSATYCMYDDGITYERATGNVVDDSIALRRGSVDFAEQGGRWTIAYKQTTDERRLESGAPNPCLGERVA